MNHSPKMLFKKPLSLSIQFMFFRSFAYIPLIFHRKNPYAFLKNMTSRQNATNAVFRRKMQLKFLYPIKPAGYNKFGWFFYPKTG